MLESHFKEKKKNEKKKRIKDDVADSFVFSK